MFEATTTFNLDLSSWTFGPGVSLKWMFKNSFAYNNGGASLNPWNMPMVSNMEGIFYGAQAFNAAINTWRTTGVDSLKNVFRGTLVFNKPLTGWDTGSVTTLEGTFQDTEVFNQALTQFDLSSALSLKDTFRGSKKYNKYIQYWGVGNVRDFSGTFADAASFNNEIWRWNLAKATTTKEMFACTNTLCRFNRAIPRNGNKWKTHLVTDMTSMFEGATTFYWNIANWDVSKVVSMKYMFKGAILFNRQLSSWDTGKVEDFSGCFSGTGTEEDPDGYGGASTQFDYALGNWDTSSATVGAFDNMFSANFHQSFDPQNPTKTWSTSCVNVVDTLCAFRVPPHINLDIATVGYDPTCVFDTALCPAINGARSEILNATSPTPAPPELTESPTAAPTAATSTNAPTASVSPTPSPTPTPTDAAIQLSPCDDGTANCPLHSNCIALAFSPTAFICYGDLGYQCIGSFCEDSYSPSRWTKLYCSENNWCTHSTHNWVIDAFFVAI
jgi:hypothetical protein